MKHEAQMVQMNAASRGLNIIIGSHFGRAASGNHLAHDYALITCQGCDQNRSSVTPRVFILPFIVPCFMKERHLSYQSITLTSDIQWPIHDKVFPLKKKTSMEPIMAPGGPHGTQQWWFPIPIQGCFFFRWTMLNFGKIQQKNQLCIPRDWSSQQVVITCSMVFWEKGVVVAKMKTRFGADAGDDDHYMGWC